MPRQGGQIALLEGRPTVLGGFYDYDKYPQVVEQFDVDTGGARCITYNNIIHHMCCRVLVPHEKQTEKRKKIFWIGSCT